MTARTPQQIANDTLGNYDFCACGRPIKRGQMQCEGCRKAGKDILDLPEVTMHKYSGAESALLAENEKLRRQRDALRDAAEAGRELSTYVNTIHWDRRKNEVEWMDGLRERVDSTWELSQRAIEEASDD